MAARRLPGGGCRGRLLVVGIMAVLASCAGAGPAPAASLRERLAGARRARSRRRLCERAPGLPRPESPRGELPGASAGARIGGEPRREARTCSRAARPRRDPPGALTPADLASAYGYTGAVGGVGQTVAIVDAYDDPKIEQDLGTFDATYGLPPCTTGDGCFTKVGQTGSPTELPAADTRGWTVEIALDVETVHSACPNCRILLVEASSEGFADLAAAVNEAVTLGATEVSNSYGGLETELGPGERAAYDHPGVVVAAAAGDSGYLNWDRLAEVFEAPGLPDAPASLPTVVAVGGTSLKLTAAGARKSESVWNDSGPPSGTGFKQFAATGGGCSTLFEAPSWQQGAAGWSAAGCGTHRLDNDVAAVADPYTGFDIYSSYIYEPAASTGWETVGGTSLSSPLVAALYGLAGGARGASYPASTLYAHLGQASLYDVTHGGDGYCDGVEPALCGEPAINEEFGPLDCVGTTACDAAPASTAPRASGRRRGSARSARRRRRRSRRVPPRSSRRPRRR